MDFRERLEASRAPQGGLPATHDSEEQPATHFYASDRGQHCTCLEFRFSDGRRAALPYSYFTELNFDPDLGIEILTSSKRVLITGRKLMALFEQMLTYRIRYVKTDVGLDMQEDGLFISGITIEPL